jgi:[citrate (pro-3S)-lyase] ligase
VSLIFFIGIISISVEEGWTVWEEKEIEEPGMIQDLLASLGLRHPGKTDYTLGLYYNGSLVGTGSLVGDTIQGLAVRPDFQGEGLAARIVSHLLKKAFDSAKEDLFIFTKPEEAWRFKELGFQEVAEARPYATLLERGVNGIDSYKGVLRECARGKPEGAACAVVNCNPFTLGHRYLLEKAAREAPWLYVLVVEEDRSLFPFPVRMELVRQGTADLENVTVIPGGRYVISSLTFPSYFTREEDLACAQAALDLEIFARHIAPVLKVRTRYVGEEPYCSLTNTYNTCMKEILPARGIDVCQVPRLMKKGQVVSASLVREMIRQDRLKAVSELVPPSTYRYLLSPESKEVRERVKRSSSRH